jgi:hypothetical protein
MQTVEHDLIARHILHDHLSAAIYSQHFRRSGLFLSR